MEEKFVFYAKYIEKLKLLENIEDQDDLLVGIVSYGVTGEYNFKNPVVKALFVASLKRCIDYSKRQHKKSIQDGGKGGRPRIYDKSVLKEYLTRGFTVKEVAMLFNCSERTVQRCKNFSEWYNANDDRNSKAKVKRCPNKRMEIELVKAHPERFKNVYEYKQFFPREPGDNSFVDYGLF